MASNYDVLAQKLAGAAKTGAKSLRRSGTVSGSDRPGAPKLPKVGSGVMSGSDAPKGVVRPKASRSGVVSGGG